MKAIFYRVAGDTWFSKEKKLTPTEGKRDTSFTYRGSVGEERKRNRERHASRQAEREREREILPPFILLYAVYYCVNIFF